MRVLFVYKYLTVGGVEAVLRARLEGLPSLGIEASAWFLADHGGRSLFQGVDASVRIGGLPALQRHLRDGGFDLVTSIDTEEVLPLFDGAGAPAPLVVEAHSAYRESLGYLRHCGEGVAAVFAPSACHAAVVRRHLGDDRPVRVVANPVHSSFVGEVVVAGSSSPLPIVAWIGRLDEHKNWRAFVALAERMLADGADAEFWMVGRPTPPHGSSALRRLTTRTGVLPRLRWLNGVPFAVMPRLLDEVRDSGGLTVSTSRGESFGMTVVEAMARACPVVVPDEPPFTDFVEHERTGHLYRAGSEDAAAREAVRLLAQPGHRRAVGRHGRDRVLDRHSPGSALAALAAEMQAVIDATLTGHDQG